MTTKISCQWRESPVRVVDVRCASPLLSVLVLHEEVGRKKLSAQSYLLSESNEDYIIPALYDEDAQNFFLQALLVHTRGQQQHAHSCTPKILADKN